MAFLSLLYRLIENDLYNERKDLLTVLFITPFLFLYVPHIKEEKDIFILSCKSIAHSSWNVILIIFRTYDFPEIRMVLLKRKKKKTVVSLIWERKGEQENRRIFFRRRARMLNSEIIRKEIDYDFYDL